MKNTIVVSLIVCSAVATAQAAAPAKETAAAPAGAPQMDMSKMGPGARKPKNESAVKKEIDDFFQKMEQADKAHDFNAMVSAVDFPVLMVTDDMNGNVESKEYSKDEYTAMMKPMMENMPKDSSIKHKPSVTVLSDSLVAVTDDFTMTMGKQKVQAKNAGLLVKKNGSWMWKSMVEAGWGGMSNTANAGMGGEMKPAETKPAMPASGTKK